MQLFLLERTIHRAAANRRASTDRSAGPCRAVPVAHSACVEVVDALRALGGTARWKQLRGHVGWRALKEARNSDEVVCVQGSWRLTTTDRPVALAHELRGVRSHRAAALHHGFALPPSDDKRYQLTLRSNAHHKKLPDDVHVRYRRLPARSRATGSITTPTSTAFASSSGRATSAFP